MLNILKTIAPVMLGVAIHIGGFILLSASPFWLAVAFRAPMVLAAHIGDVVFGLSRVPMLISEKHSVLWPEFLIGYATLFFVGVTVDRMFFSNLTPSLRCIALSGVILLFPLLVALLFHAFGPKVG